MSCVTILFSKHAKHQIRHDANYKTGCQPGDCMHTSEIYHIKFCSPMECILKEYKHTINNIQWRPTQIIGYKNKLFPMYTCISKHTKSTRINYSYNCSHSRNVIHKKKVTSQILRARHINIGIKGLPNVFQMDFLWITQVVRCSTRWENWSRQLSKQTRFIKYAPH